MKSEGTPGSSQDPELDALICDCLNLLLSTLAPEQAAIVHRVDVGGETPEDIAESLGIRPEVVADQLVRGRVALTERFAQMSRICPEHGLTGCECDLRDEKRS